MPDFPKIHNPFEDEAPSIDETTVSEIAHHAGKTVANQVTTQVIKPIIDQVKPDDIVGFLYGVDESSSDPHSAEQDPQQSHGLEEQKKQQAHASHHQQEYFTLGNKLKDIGSLEQEVQKMRQLREQEEQQRKQLEEEEEQRKRQEEAQRNQQMAMPTGKKTGLPTQRKSQDMNQLENKSSSH